MSAHCLHAGLRKRVVLINLKIPPSPLSPMMIYVVMILIINGHHGRRLRWQASVVAGGHGVWPVSPANEFMVRR